MKYIKQFCIIIAMSFLGEALRAVLPFPVPGSIYGMLLLFLVLCLGIVKLEQVREVGLFLVEIMPILFVSAGVGLMESWDILQPILFPVVFIMLVTTVVVMVAAGWSTQAMILFLEKSSHQKFNGQKQEYSGKERQE